jgi:acyl-CoA thioesterase
MISTMSQLLEYFATDRFATGIGIELLEAKEGYARARLALTEGHLNAAGVVQGGVVFTLADYAFAACSNSHGTLALAINASISFLRALRGGVLTAEAREEALSRAISTCQVRVTDEQGALVALFNGSAFRKSNPVPPA